MLGIIDRVCFFITAVMAIVIAGFLPSAALYFIWGIEVDARIPALIVYSITAALLCYWNITFRRKNIKKQAGGE